MDGTESSSSSMGGGGHELFFNFNYRHRMSMRFYDQIMAVSGDSLRERKRQTGLHLERHREMVQATFTLMKRVVIMDSKLDCRHKLTVDDFRRAYNLVHDWYPQLTTAGPAFQEMWRQSKVEMLQALSRLAQQKVLHGQENAPDFEAWVEAELADAVLSEEESGRMSRFPPLTDENDPAVLRAHCHHNLLAMHALMSQGETRTHQHTLTNGVKSVLRLIYLVLVADTFVLYESGCLGLLMQFFLDLNIKHMGRFIYDQWPTVLSAPVLVVVAAGFGANFLELTKDAMNDPPFKLVCSHFFVAGETIIQHNHCFHHKTWWRMLLARGVDFFFTYLLAIMVGVGLLKWGLNIACRDKDIHSRGFMNSYMHGAVFGGLMWVVLTWSLYGLCWLYTTADVSQRRFATTNLLQVLIRCIQGYGIRPGTYTRFFLTVSRHLELAEEDDVKTSQRVILSWVDKENKRNAEWKEYAWKLAQVDGGLHVSRHCEGWLMAVGAFVMWPFTYVVVICGLLQLFERKRLFDALCSGDDACVQSKQHVLAVWLCSILVSVAVLVTAGFVCRLMPNMNNMSFKSHVVAFCVLNIFMTGLSTFEDWEAKSKLKVIVGANETGGFYNDPYKQNGATINPYPVCSNFWGVSTSKVDVIDLGLLAWYSYEKDTKNFTDLVKATFEFERRPEVEIIDVSDFAEIPRVAVVRIPDKNSSNSTLYGTVVIAVKGTSTMAEAFADMGMYTTMVSLQIADKIAPLLHTFPTSIIAAAVGMTEIPFSQKTADQFLADLGRQVNRTRERFKEHRIILTGHSLGGGLAEIVGAQLDVPAVVFSAPGNVFLTKALSIPKPMVYKNIIGVMPDDDVVPSIDDHADMVQHIQCIDYRGEPRQFLECHGMLVTLCELYRVCGDRFERNFSRWCTSGDKPYVHPNCIGKDFGEGKGDKKCPR